jgi:hypothetical protein
MMRAWLAPLTLLATCAALLLGAVHVGRSEASASAGASAAQAASRWRAWPLKLSAAPDDLALAEIDFHGGVRGQRISAGSLLVSVSKPFGDDYLAAGALAGAPGAQRALVLLVNRPSPLMDPVSVGLRLSALASLGSVHLYSLANPFTQPLHGDTPALCNLDVHGSTLGAAAVRPLHRRGHALVGFDAASSLAQAYDVVCGLPYAASFAQAIGRPAPVAPTPVPAPTPSPSPVPAPPSPSPPGCVPCNPEPGYACPLTAKADICAAAVAGASRRAAAGAH